MLDRLRNLKGPRVFGVMTILMALVLGGAYYKQVSCQAQYNKAFSKSLVARSEASKVRTDALDAVVGGVGVLILDPPMTAAQKAAAGTTYVNLFSTYQTASLANKKAQADNPYPALPDC